MQHRADKTVNALDLVRRLSLNEARNQHLLKAMGVQCGGELTVMVWESTHGSGGSSSRSFILAAVEAVLEDGGIQEGLPQRLADAQTLLRHKCAAEEPGKVVMEDPLGREAVVINDGDRPAEALVRHPLDSSFNSLVPAEDATSKSSRSLEVVPTSTGPTAATSSWRRSLVSGGLGASGASFPPPLPSPPPGPMNPTSPSAPAAVAIPRPPNAPFPPFPPNTKVMS